MATENLPSAGVSTVRPAVHGVKNVAFFVENRNGVHLAVAIARALPDDVTPLFFTADAQGRLSSGSRKPSPSCRSRMRFTTSARVRQAPKVGSSESAMPRTSSFEVTESMSLCCSTIGPVAVPR